MMLSVPINGQVQSRLIPPTFVEDNISDMFKAVDAGHNIVVTAVDEYGNRTSITTPDNVNHDMLGRPLEFASHPVLMRNVRRWMVWLLQAQYCKDYKWDTNRLGGWMEVLGLPADLDIPVTEEHLRMLKPVFNKDDADPYRLVARYDKQHYASCTLSTLIRLAEQTTPNYALNNSTRWCQTDRYRKLSIQPNPKENWDGMDRVRDCWSGCEWAYPALERYYNPIRLLRDEYRRGGLPETFHYPIHTTRGEYRLAKGQISPHATILLNGKPVGLMFSDDCEEPFTDRIPPEWCATPLPENYKTTPLNRNIPVNGEFKPSFQQAMLGFVEWYEKTHKG